MNPFVDITVRPAYGRFIAVVTWKMLPGFEDADFYVYRSETGVRDWVLLNDLALGIPIPIRNLSEKFISFSDNKLLDNDQFRNLYYRILCRKGTEDFHSPIASTLSKLTMVEYRAVRRIMNAEFDQMTRGRQGLAMWLYKPLTTGAPIPGFDEETGQQFNSAAPKDPNLDGYGQPYIGGFSGPVMTWVKLAKFSPLQVKDAQDGSTTNEEQIISARMLAFPPVRREDLLVHPESDNRYAVGDTVQDYYFAGRIPIAYDVQIQLLARHDPRYRLPVPQMPIDPRTEAL